MGLGSSFLLVELALTGLCAPQIVAVRLVVGASVLWMVVLAQGRPIPRGRRQ